MALWESNPEVQGSLRLIVAECRREITSTEGFHDWERQAVPHLNYILAFSLQLKESTETSVRVAECTKLFSRDCLEGAAEHLSPLPVGGLSVPSELPNKGVHRGS
ncbi:hypothetical protein L798_04802 [Zootermopsis nevadensis]|uniref:Uncharacterized protein n=1 Tax=Zootermopsis nevadensis TaxID=136037 RepID=A0A067RAN8_ZOONE|nr:hypothetical protein L798_04802 [Zootermopsis nevadensis]